MPFRSFILIALLLAVPASRAGTTLIVGEATAEIPVTATIGELAKTAEIDVESAKIHVGIQANTCDVGEGVLVYVYETATGKPERDSDNLRFLDTPKTMTGSVVVECKSLDTQVMQVREYARRVREDRMITKGPALYVCPVHFSAPGKYAIRVFTRDEDVVAATTVTVADGDPSSLFPIQIDQHDDHKDLPFKGLIEPTPAIPKWNSQLPVPVAADGKLPRMIPEESADFKIEAAAGDISIVLNRDTNSDFSSNFLARIWINGKPAEASEKSEFAIRRAMKSDYLTAPVKFRVHPDLKQFPIRPTDKVEIQLIYSVHGIQRWEHEFSRKEAVRLDEGPHVLTSNKITLQEGR